MKRKIRFGIVGAGRVAGSYVQAFENCAEAALVAVVDSRPEAARAMAGSANCPSYESHEEMCRNSELDAAIVCTPPVTHPEICIHLLNQKVNVLCEKPLSFDIRKAFQMFDAARNNKVQLTMASKFRYVEDVIRAKRMAASGVIGEVVLCENVFTSRVDMASRWNSNPEISGGGVLIDNGTHSVDLIRYFLGPLAEMHVLEGKRSQGLQVEETVSVFLRSVSGIIATVDLSWSINKPRSSYLDIYGSNGAISVGWKESKLFDYSSNDVVVFGSGYDRVQAFRSQIENFSHAVRGDQGLLVSEDDALASVNVIGIAYKALRQNQWTPVPPPDCIPVEDKVIRNLLPV